MNTVVVKFELSEALEHLQKLLAELVEGRIGEDDDAKLLVEINHLLDHMNLAWNGRNMSWAELQSLPHGEFMRLSNTVPNYLGEKVLGPVPLVTGGQGIPAHARRAKVSERRWLRGSHGEHFADRTRAGH